MVKHTIRQANDTFLPSSSQIHFASYLSKNITCNNTSAVIKQLQLTHD